MSKKTRQYSKELIATTTEQYLEIPRYTKMSIINFGNVNVDINLDNDIADATYEKIILRPNVPYQLPTGGYILHYQATSGSQSLQVVGSKMDRE